MRQYAVKMLAAAFLTSLLLYFPLSVSYALPVNPVSYDMPNGGSDSGFYYWDRKYLSPDNMTDYGNLTGGLGDLTDGTVASENFYLVENVAGTGP